MIEVNPSQTTAAAQPATRSRKRRLKSDWLIGYLFILPWAIGFLCFTAGPFLASLFLSMTDWRIIGAFKWVGLGNYTTIFTQDPRFLKTLFNTLYYVAFVVPGVNVIGLTFAMLLNQKLKGIAIYRTVFYMPAVTSGVATSILWAWMFNPRFGLINSVLAMIGIQGPEWLVSDVWAMPSIIIMSLWNIGQPMIIYLAGLQGVPRHLEEAAEMDGAGWWQKFRNVTIPMLTPSIFFNVVMGIIGSFQVFTTVYVVTQGGPAESTLVYVLNLYYTAFQNFRMGYASALAWILFVIILAFTGIQFLVSRSWVYYEGGGRGA